MELTQFQQPKISIEDFNLETMKKDVPLNTKAAAQLAAGEVILSNEPSVDEFRSLRDSLTSQAGRQQFILKQEQRRVDILSSFKDDLTSIVLDPSLSNEDKLKFVQGVKSAPESFRPSTLDIMVQEAVAAQSRPDETDDEVDIRLEFVDMIDEVVKVKREATARVNALRAERDPNLTSMAVDLAEIMVPFTEWVDINQLYQEVVGGDAWLMGSQREALFNMKERIPFNKRAEFNEKLIQFIEENDSVLLPDGNDLIALDNLEQMLVEEDYSNTEKWFDNTVSLLEATGVLALLGRGIKAGGKAVQSTNRFGKQTVRTDVAPTSPSQMIKDANPEKARAMHEAVVADPTDEAAEALYGSSKTEALAKDELPEPELEPGAIQNKIVQRSEPEFTEPENIRSLRQTSGNTFISEAEEARVAEKVVRDFSEVEGMKIHKESITVRSNDDCSVGISVIYRPTDVGFKSAAQAMDNAKFAFRHYGLEEEHLTLYRRSGDKWIITTPKLLKARAELRASLVAKGQKIPPALKDIDYAVGVDYNYRFRPEDLKDYDLLSTGRIAGILPVNILDRIPPVGIGAVKGQGSLTQNFLDAASVLHPQIVNPASVAVDKAVALKKAYVNTFEGFTKGYKGLSEDRREAVSDYIHQANFEGIKFSENDLYAKGFGQKEVELLREWRKSNDIMFQATNDDMAKTLRNKGFQIYVDEANDTKLMVRPVKRGSVSSKTQFYNSSTNKVETFDSKEQLDLFYEEGGTLAQLSEPIKIGEEWVDIIQVNEKSNSGYMRAIKDGERVLNYRDGYYPVMYDANFFIYKTIRKADGTTFQKTVGSAKNKNDARKMVEMLRADDPDAIEIDFRPDRRADQERASSFDEAGWSLGVSSGISAQRVRGERLADATGGLLNVGNSNLHDPLEAVSNQISQLSQRVAMRDYLDTTKKRWVENYGEALGIEPDRAGNIRFPSSITQVVGKGTADAQTVADARTLFNYLYSLENGYINGIDEAFKAVFNLGADLMSGLKWNAGEEALRDWGKGSLTSTSKAAVFKMYLAANPARQLVIQAHQAVQLNAINPLYTTGGGMSWDLYRLGRAMRGYEGDKEAVDMLKQLQNSGMLDAVDANNLVRQDMLRLADLTVAQKAKTVANAPLKAAQIVGFDTAERFVLVTSWLAHRNLAKKAGKTMNARTLDEIAGQARAFTFAMNRAGDMPYNQNSLNIIAQFLQVPHKAMLQPLTNRSLSPRDRLKLLTWNTVLYGVPAGITGSMLYDTFEPGPLRDSIENGLEHVLLNEVASAITGEEQSVDWGDFTPTDLHGMSEFLLGMWTTDIGSLVANSPAGSLIAGVNPRLANLMSTTARWVHLKDDYDDPTLETKYTDVAAAAANLFSGYSNAFKAKYAFETGKKISSLGSITDQDVTKFEAVMQFFGFRTTTEESTRKIQEKLLEGQSFTDNDVTLWYGDLKRQLARRGLTVKDQEMAQRILTEGQRVFQDDPVKFQERLFSLVKNDVEKNQFNVFEQVMKQMGWKTRSELIELAGQLPEGEEKRVLIDAINRLGERE